MMSKEANVRAILECNFTGFKDEIIDTAVELICDLECEPITSPSEHMMKMAEGAGDIAMAEINFPKDMVKKIIPQAEETEEEFILTTISPFAQNVIQKIIPKEDLKEVLIRGFRRGNWKMIGDIGMAYECSECESVEVKKSKFCPNCGVMMNDM